MFSAYACPCAGYDSAACENFDVNNAAIFLRELVSGKTSCRKRGDVIFANGNVPLFLRAKRRTLVAATAEHEQSDGEPVDGISH